jgi:aspartate/methionine/tyrosine aminotransferase
MLIVILTSVDRFVKKELLAMGAGSMTRSMPPMPPDTINLLAGDPDFNQPELINKAVYEAMREGHTHYSFTGEPDFKQAIADYYGKYGVEVDPNTQIQITSGGSQAIFRAFGTILNPGDEILLMDPCYTGYDQPAAYFGGKLKKAAQKKDEKGLYRPDFENVEKAITDNTKAVLFCSPDNPTGAVWTEDEIGMLAEIAVERDLLVLSDEIYTEFIWGESRHVPIIDKPGMLERTMVLMSFSKTFAWTGCRAGYIISGPELMKKVGGVPIGICGVPVPFQKAAVKALEEGWEFVESMRDEYRRRLEYVVPRLDEIDGVSCPMPEGAFYVFPDVSQLNVPTLKFIMDLVQSQRLLVAPGVIYGSKGEGHVRLALIKPMEVLKEACERFERHVKTLRD